MIWKKGASLVAQLVKNLPAVWETWVQSLGWEDPLDTIIFSHSEGCLYTLLKVSLMCRSSSKSHGFQTQLHEGPETP